MCSRTARVDAALAASVFHSGVIAIPDLKAYLPARGIEVRNDPDIRLSNHWTGRRPAGSRRPSSRTPETLQVLMLGYMNREALEQTVQSGLVAFYSRSKQRQWQKGESTGHVLKLVGVRLDCDQDTLLIAAKPQGPTCHLGTSSCFGEDTPRR